MRAVVCKAWGPPSSLVLEQDVATPQPREGEVLIDVHACGVNFTDTLLIAGTYQLKPPFPFSPGAEVAGLVRATGAGVVGFAPGDRVAAMTSHGGFAQCVVAEAGRTARLPDTVSFESGAALLMGHGTAAHALIDRAELRPGQTVLVLGAAGGVGLAAVEVARLLGARVLAVASTADKRAACRAQGADETIDPAQADMAGRVMAITAGRGVDVVFDPVGGDLAQAALRSLAWRGRYLVVGFAAGSIPRLPLDLPMHQGSTIAGVLWGAFLRREPQRGRERLQQLVDWAGAGRLRPRIQRVYPLQSFADALQAIGAREVIGKLVLAIPGVTNA